VRITRIETHTVGAGWKNWLFVRVHTDEGLIGLGEATLNGFIRGTEATVHELAHLVIGMDPRHVKRVAATMFERVSLDGGHLHRTAIAGVEVACWDILGKSLGVPVHQLLGGAVRDTVEAYANGWYRTERTPEAFAQAAVAATARGFHALKFDPLGTTKGFFQHGDLALTRDIIATVRTAVGPGVKLLIDVHARLVPAEAVRLIDRCADLDVFWWEEPTTREREEPTNAVAARTAGTIASGEMFDTVGQFLTLVKGGGVAILQPEPMSLGGITPTLAVAAIAAADGSWIAPHQSGGPVATATCLQLAATVPNFLIQEHFDPFNEDWTADLVSWAPRLDPANGHLDLPQAPGLGLVLNLDVVADHPYDPKAFLDVHDEGWERRLGKRQHDA
jgi:galactonate dehydratase